MKTNYSIYHNKLDSLLFSHDKILFVGVGNVLKSDDGVGVYICKQIVPNNFILTLNVEMSIENYIGKIEKINPDLVIIIDSVDFNQNAGFYDLVSGEENIVVGADGTIEVVVRGPHRQPVTGSIGRQARCKVISFVGRGTGIQHVRGAGYRREDILPEPAHVPEEPPQGACDDAQDGKGYREAQGEDQGILDCLPLRPFGVAADVADH